MKYPVLKSFANSLAGSFAVSFGAAALVVCLAAMPARAGQIIRGDIHETYTYDVPWDWAHRYPPNVVTSDRPYVSSCPVEVVKTGGDSKGRAHTVNVMRCY